jgi:hypothetical protein
MLFQIKAAFKYLLSFRKKEWTINDYPIRFKRFEISNEEQYGRLQPVPWSAQIINWWQMGGDGDTKEAAFADLKKNLEALKENGTSLPRPGTGLPIEFASTEKVSLHSDIAGDFFERVLEQNYDDCWISDESSLWDFHGEETNEHLHKKIWECYRVDVSDIEDGNLVKIFERIENR